VTVKSQKAKKRRRQKMSVAVTAGPTAERIDPVRFITNPSSGMMGFELAAEARKRGHKVFLIKGPVSLPCISGVESISVESARDMLGAVKNVFDRVDCVIMAAAVSDFRPTKIAEKKLKKNKARVISLKLTRTDDILTLLGRNKRDKILVGFSLETDNVKENAIRKMKSKNLDIIVSNSISKSNNPFGQGKKRFYLIEKSKDKEKKIEGSKKKLAIALLDSIEKLWYTNGTN
jgi:phosphopantothenoylcysteine decarboxylase/phosphopantothenate--cysteine ligase